MENSLYIITGASSGIGEQISLLLLKKKKIVLGISRTRLNIKNKKYRFIKHDFKSKFNIKKILNYIKQFKSFTIICTAGTRSSFKYNIKTLTESMNINFFNQINFIFDLSKIKKIRKVVFFSSFNIFRKKNIKDVGYYLSKKIMFDLTKNDKSEIFQCYLMGNISTKMNKNHPSIIKSIPIIGPYLENKIAIKPNYIAKFVIKNLNKSTPKVFFFPNFPLFLIKIFIFLLEIINKFLHRNYR
jgi:short-subunit dehydrogenase